MRILTATEVSAALTPEETEEDRTEVVDEGAEDNAVVTAVKIEITTDGEATHAEAFENKAMVAQTEIKHLFLQLKKETSELSHSVE
jgi:hypothetical protein